jgi:hypothetical protein
MRALAVVFALGVVALAFAWGLRRAAGASSRWAPPAQRRTLVLVAIAACLLGVLAALRPRNAFDFAPSLAAGVWAAGAMLLGAVCALGARRMMLAPEEEEDDVGAPRGVLARGAAVLFASAGSILALGYLLGLSALVRPPQDALVGASTLVLGFGAGQALVYALEGGGLLDALVLDAGPGIVLAAALFERNVERIPGAPPIPPVVLFSLVARGFGLVASAAGLVATAGPSEARERSHRRRREEAEPGSTRVDGAARAALRGAYVAAFVSVIGVGGAVRWIFGAAHVLPLYYAALLGVATALTLLLVPTRFSAAPIVVAVAAALGAHALASRAGLPGAGAFGIAVALAGMLGPAGVILALEGTDRDRHARAYAGAASALAVCVVVAAVLVVVDERSCGAWVDAMRLPAGDWLGVLERCRAAGPVFARVDLGAPAVVSALAGAALGWRIARACAKDASARRGPALLVMLVPLAVAAVFTIARGSGGVALAAVLATAGATVMASFVAHARDNLASASLLRAMLVLLGAAALAASPLV